jgi:hypothetical protein
MKEINYKYAHEYANVAWLKKRNQTIPGFFRTGVSRNAATAFLAGG